MGVGRPPHDHGALANAFVARAVLELPKTAALIERLQIDRALKRICGFPMISRISRDGTAIEAREKPVKRPPLTVAPIARKIKRGRPKKGEVREAKRKRIGQQPAQTLKEMLAELPKAYDPGSKCNAQGYRNSWNGYKLHLDTADCGVPVSTLLTSASAHDSQTAVPLSMMTWKRVTNCTA